jgi:hypothetical protein
MWTTCVRLAAAGGIILLVRSDISNFVHKKEKRKGFASAHAAQMHAYLVYVG